MSDDPDLVMPPAQSNHQLKPEQKKMLSEWIASGADYKPHWAYVAPVRTKLPDVDIKGWFAIRSTSLYSIV